MSLSGLRSDNIYDSSLTVVLAGLLVGIKACPCCQHPAGQAWTDLVTGSAQPYH